MVVAAKSSLCGWKRRLGCRCWGAGSSSADGYCREVVLLVVLSPRLCPIPPAGPGHLSAGTQRGLNLAHFLDRSAVCQHCWWLGEPARPGWGAAPMRRSQTRPDAAVLVLLECGLARRNVLQRVYPLGACVCAAQRRLSLFKSTSPRSQKKSRQNQLTPQNPQNWSETILTESSGLPMSTEGRAGVCLEAAGPAQQLAVHNLQRKQFPSEKAVVSGKTPVSRAFPTARCSSSTSRHAGQPDGNAAGMTGEGLGSAACPVLC